MLQIREEVSFTKGRIIVRGKLVTRGKAKRADYILYYKPNIPIALIEAKDNNHSVGDGMQQAPRLRRDARHPVRLLLERRRLRVPRPHRHERRDGSQPRASTPSRRRPISGRSYRAWKGLDAGGRADRPAGLLRRRQRQGARATTRCNAINAAIEAIAKGQDRILLVMATGTGKTYTAFQIIWRLWKAGRKKRILFLADRNVLVDQTMVNDFRPFGAAMAKLSTSAKTIEREDGTEDRAHHSRSTRSAASTPPTRSISASIRRSPARRSGRSSSASSRPASST